MALPQAYGTANALTIAYPSSGINQPGACQLPYYTCRQHLAIHRTGCTIAVRDDFQAIFIDPADESDTVIGVTFKQQFLLEDCQACWGIYCNGGLWTAVVCTSQTSFGAVVDYKVCLQTSSSRAPINASDWTLGRTIIATGSGNTTPCVFGPGDGGMVIEGSIAAWNLTTDLTAGSPVDITTNLNAIDGGGLIDFHPSPPSFPANAIQNLIIDITSSGFAPTVMQVFTRLFWPDGTFFECQASVSDGAGGVYFITDTGTLKHQANSGASPTTVLSGVIPAGNQVYGIDLSPQNSSVINIIHLVLSPPDRLLLTQVTVSGTPSKVDGDPFAWPRNQLLTWNAMTDVQSSSTDHTFQNNWTRAVTNA